MTLRKSVISITEALRILGTESDNKSDDDIQQMINDLEVLAKMALETALRHQQEQTPEWISQINKKSKTL